MIDTTKFELVGLKRDRDTVMWLKGWLDLSIVMKVASVEDIEAYNEKHAESPDFKVGIEEDLNNIYDFVEQNVGEEIVVDEGNWNYTMSKAFPRLITINKITYLFLIGSVYDISRPTNDTWIAGFGWVDNDKVEETLKVLGPNRHQVGMV